MKRTKIAVILILTILFSLISGSCSPERTASWNRAVKQMNIIKGSKPGKSPQAALNRKDTLVIGTSDFSGVFNPAWAESANDSIINSLVFGSLIESDFDARPIPGMADFKISNDNLTYTLTIKEGVRFSDGTPLTAYDVEFTYYVLCDPSYDGPSDPTSVNIIGAAEYYNNQSDTIPGIRVIDDRTIEIKTDRVNAQTIWFLGGSVLSRDYYGKYYKKGDLEAMKDLNDKPFGAGPYKLTEYRLGESVTLVRNDNYFKGTPKINRVIYSVTPSGQELERLKLGEIDIAYPTVSEENVSDAIQSGFIDIYRYPTNGYGYIGIKNDDPKYSDKRVRQALVYALNRKGIVKAVYGSYADVINIPQSKVSWSYTEEGIKAYEFNLKKAEALLKEAGWVKNSRGKLEKDGREFKILFSAIQGHPVTDPMLPVMKDDYAKLGIDVEIEYVDFPTLLDKAHGGTADMWFMAWSLSSDPNPYNIYGSDGSQNTYHYKNPEADRLMKEALKTTDIEKRKGLYKKVYQILNDDVPCIWVYQRSDMWAVNSRVKNFRVSPYRDYSCDLYKTELSGS